MFVEPIRLSSSSAIADTQFFPPPPTKEKVIRRSFDLNLRAPREEDHEDEHSPSLTLFLGWQEQKD